MLWSSDFALVSSLLDFSRRGEERERTDDRDADREWDRDAE